MNLMKPLQRKLNCIKTEKLISFQNKELYYRILEIQPCNVKMKIFEKANRSVLLISLAFFMHIYIISKQINVIHFVSDNLFQGFGNYRA